MSKRLLPWVVMACSLIVGSFLFVGMIEQELRQPGMSYAAGEIATWLRLPGMMEAAVDRSAEGMYDMQIEGQYILERSGRQGVEALLAGIDRRMRLMIACSDPAEQRNLQKEIHRLLFAFEDVADLEWGVTWSSNAAELNRTCAELGTARRELGFAPGAEEELMAAIREEPARFDRVFADCTDPGKPNGAE
ncbi:MAG TPA: hypothetical protein PLP01_00450 [Phycisphaerae bacterium]|nr:hypothetical protein [Phycisphaerae bacterium]